MSTVSLGVDRFVHLVTTLAQALVIISHRLSRTIRLVEQEVQQQEAIMELT